MLPGADPENAVSFLSSGIRRHPPTSIEVISSLISDRYVGLSEHLIKRDYAGCFEIRVGRRG
jgi:hypothetical protein